MATSEEPRRLASLPGYDTAPDIYETPDLTDDTSTTLQTSTRSPSVSSATTDEEGSDDQNQTHGVSRRRLFPDRARTRFAATSNRVETKHVDLSDRVDGRRRGYKVRRVAVAGDDEEEEEGLEARIARLRREIEECRAQAQDEQVPTDEKTDENIDGLGRMLKEVEIASKNKAKSASAVTTNVGTAADAAEENLTDEQAMQKVIDFDSRLSALEAALGISSLDSATQESTTTPLIPTLILLDQQLSAVSTAASLTSLDAASHQLDKLKRQAAELSSSLHGSGTPANDSSRPPSSNSNAHPQFFSPEDSKQLQGLYALLPNLQALAPTVPAILERLRSLRALHTTAATAAADLEELEKRQAEIDQDLSTWTQGLERVEGAIRQASEANGKNGMVVESWVKDLEGRMKSLSR